jgi:PAS domain S-box-containing protein
MWLIAVAAVPDPAVRVRSRHVKFARAGAVPYVFVGIIGAVTLVEMQRGVADDLLLAGVTALALVVLRQIVTLRQALASQRRETAFREAVLETQSDLGLGMAILHGTKLIYANQAAERITGMTSAELRSVESVAELRFGAADESEWLTWLGNPDSPIDTTFTRRDGTVVDIEVVARWMRATGEPQLLLVARDVTARRQADEALAQAQKLEGLGALAGGVAHDFNNLLSSVLGNVGLLQLGELDDEATETVANIESAVKRGADLTRSLLDFARVQPAGFAVEDLRECLKETASLARTALPVNVGLTVSPGAEPILVRLNRGQVIQASAFKKSCQLSARVSTSPVCAMRSS